MSVHRYSDYQLKDTTRTFLSINQFVMPTQIQQKVIPLALKGKDIIAHSPTGTGKTHAFLIALMEHVDPTLPYVQAVITAPTRELALQLYERAKGMNEADPRLQVRLISGGMEKSRMKEGLKRAVHVVIGTPGRIRDLFLQDQTLLLQHVSMLVVDEADMTLEYGFLEDVDAIASRMRKDLQMLSFSATIPNGLKPFLKKYMHDPVTIQVREDYLFQPRIEHVLIPCRHLSYAQKVLELLPSFQPYVCLIFANTRSEAATMAEMLRDASYDVIELHGALSPRERTRAMKALMKLEHAYVVATDIAARGIDIEGVSHVISMGFPKELDFYIHRSGRTGRAGKDGICFALYAKADENSIQTLQKRGIHFQHRQFKNGVWSDLKAKNAKAKRQEDPLTKEISKRMSRKSQKVKPGYKAKRKQEIERLKRRAKRELIQKDIQRQKKERAKAAQMEKRGSNE
ncbi:MAG: DEAD/DEAH box helicase [Erysipelotrichaceae bacterium]|nr:DEAD/DEAH box helicase [Erysipelotrichaceae bacterium]